MQLEFREGHLCCDGVSRRDFIRVGFLTFAGLGLADFFRIKAASADPNVPKEPFA